MLHYVSKDEQSIEFISNPPVGFIEDNKLVSALGQSDLLLSETLDPVANHIDT